MEVLIGALALVVGLVIGYMLGTMPNDKDATLNLILNQVNRINLTLEERREIKWEEKKVEKEYRTQPVKTVDAFPEEDLISDTQIEQMLYDTYPKEMIVEFLALSEVEKQQVINELKSQRNGNSQSIHSETG